MDEAFYTGWMTALLAIERRVNLSVLVMCSENGGEGHFYPRNIDEHQH